MRHLKGYKTVMPLEFRGELLSAVLAELALYCAGREASQTAPPEWHLDPQYYPEDGMYVIFVFEME